MRYTQVPKSRTVTYPIALKTSMAVMVIPMPTIIVVPVMEEVSVLKPPFFISSVPFPSLSAGRCHAVTQHIYPPFYLQEDGRGRRKSIGLQPSCSR